jgi:nucleoside-diphosphate-sugar epimerase
MSTISIIGSGGMAAAIGSLAAKAGHAVEVTSRNVAMAGTLEKGPAGKNWHGIEGDGIRFREIAEAIGSRLGLPAVSIPADVLMLPAYFGFLANLVTLDLPATNLITRQTLGWEPAQPRLLADLDNGRYFEIETESLP